MITFQIWLSPVCYKSVRFLVILMHFRDIWVPFRMIHRVESFKLRAGSLWILIGIDWIIWLNDLGLWNDCLSVGKWRHLIGYLVTLCHCVTFPIRLSIRFEFFDKHFANSFQPINSFDQLASIDRYTWSTFMNCQPVNIIFPIWCFYVRCFQFFITWSQSTFNITPSILNWWFHIDN